LSSTVQNTEAARSKETPAPKKNVKKLQAALPCADAAANLLEEQASNEMNEEGPPVPKKNVKKLPAARQCVKVAANLLDAQESIENEVRNIQRYKNICSNITKYKIFRKQEQKGRMGSNCRHKIRMKMK